MNVTTIGIDLAKTVFSIHGTDQHGKVVVRKRLNRPKLLPYTAQLPPEWKPALVPTTGLVK